MQPRDVSSEELSGLLMEAMLDKKGENVVRLDLRSIPNRAVDFFVICHGNSGTQVDAITESVHRTVKQATGHSPRSTEGRQLNEWVLIDYFDVVAHVFTGPVRAFYRLEDLWADAEVFKPDVKE